nr:TetR/AcrR family transcriptional regulator C-terminal domain-containing protein [uncultured Oscillibacter sp.]
MNTPNNKRRKASRNKIETAFIELLQHHELNKINVTALCRTAGVNRTTFYANYLDICDLADAVQKRLEEEVAGLFWDSAEPERSGIVHLRLLRHIRENQLFYKAYFKLGLDGRFQLTEYNTQMAAAYYDGQYIEYHIEFFRNGFNAVIKKWLRNDCRETPEEIYSVIVSEYTGRSAGLTRQERLPSADKEPRHIP